MGKIFKIIYFEVSVGEIMWLITIFSYNEPYEDFACIFVFVFFFFFFFGLKSVWQIARFAKTTPEN
jgi:hypothetical protein